MSERRKYFVPVLKSGVTGPGGNSIDNETVLIAVCSVLQTFRSTLSGGEEFHVLVSPESRKKGGLVGWGLQKENWDRKPEDRRTMVEVRVVE